MIISLSGLQFSTAFQFHGNCPRVFAYHRKINNLWMSFPTHWSWWNGCTIHASLPYMGSFCWSIFLSDFFMSIPTVFRLLQHYQRIANFLKIFNQKMVLSGTQLLLKFLGHFQGINSNQNLFVFVVVWPPRDRLGFFPFSQLDHSKLVLRKVWEKSFQATTDSDLFFCHFENFFFDDFSNRFSISEI